MLGEGRKTTSSRRGRWGMFLVSVIIGLAVSELVLRMFVPQETKRLATYDEDLGWRGSPGGEGVYVRSIDGIRAEFRYNEHGFRDEPFPGSNGTRILLLGDSFLEALEVEYEKTFHRILERKLKNDRESVEVSIIASQGYSTAQELLGLRKYRNDLSPDLVLLVFYTGNDFRENLRKEFTYLDENGTLKLATTRRSSFEICKLSVERWLYEHSHLVFFLKNSYESLTGRRAGAAAREVEPASREEMLARTRELILLMVDEVCGHGAAFGIAILPSGKELESGDFDRLHYVQRICEEQSIPFLSFESRMTPNLLFPYDGHLNEQGHETVGHSLYDFVYDSFPWVMSEGLP